MPNTYNTTAAQTDRYTQTLCMFYGVYVVLTELRATEPAEDTYGHTLVLTGLFAQLHTFRAELRPIAPYRTTDLYS